MSVLERIKKMRFVIDKMTENAATFPTPNPSLAVISGLASALEQAETDATPGGKDRTELRDIALQKAIDGMNLLVLYVQGITLGNREMTALAGLETQAVPSKWPTPGMPTGFKVRPGSLEGSIYMFCSGTKFKKTYVFEMWVDDPEKGGYWKEIQAQTSGRYQHEGLERGKIYRFRVYAKNSAGRGTASSEASCAAR